MNRVFLCLGGNLGNRLDYLEKALTLINSKAGKVHKTSPVYETQPWDSDSAKPYLNMCAELQTVLSADELISVLLEIEKKLGRKRSVVKNSDRTIDIDIVYFNSEVIKTKLLQVPHPRLHLRKFVLIPLNDIAPSFKHPILKKTTKKLLANCKDKLRVNKFTPAKTKIICIEGNIGSGKSTLALALSKKLKALYLPEEFKDNPLLPLFYKNPVEYAYPLETSFLLNRFQQISKAVNENAKLIIADYAFYKCLWFAKINLKGKELKEFKALFKTLNAEIPQPHLLVVINTHSKNLHLNIKKRGRSFEKKIETSYLEKINVSYKKGLKKINHIPQLHIEIEKYKKTDLPMLVKQITEHIM